MFDVSPFISTSLTNGSGSQTKTFKNQYCNKEINFPIEKNNKKPFNVNHVGNCVSVFHLMLKLTLVLNYINFS